jgi:hypothetical protein
MPKPAVHCDEEEYLARIDWIVDSLLLRGPSRGPNDLEFGGQHTTLNSSHKRTAHMIAGNASSVRRDGERRWPQYSLVRETLVAYSSPYR